MNEAEQLARASAADAILQHPLLMEALNDYERTLVETWRSSKPREAKEREELHRMLQAQAHFRAYLTQVVVTGKLIRAKVKKPTQWDRIKDRTLRAWDPT